MLSGWRSLPVLLVIDNLSLCWAQGFRLWNFLSLLSCSAPTRHLGIHPLTPPSAGSSSTSRARWPQAHPHTGLTRSHTHTVHMFTHTYSHTHGPQVHTHTESTCSHTHTQSPHFHTHGSHINTHSPHIHTHRIHMFTDTHRVHIFTHTFHTQTQTHTHTHSHIHAFQSQIDLGSRGSPTLLQGQPL